MDASPQESKVDWLFTPESRSTLFTFCGVISWCWIGWTCSSLEYEVGIAAAMAVDHHALEKTPAWCVLFGRRNEE
jgi:hypothetical protein